MPITYRYLMSVNELIDRDSINCMLIKILEIEIDIIAVMLSLSLLFNNKNYILFIIINM